MRSPAALRLRSKPRDDANVALVPLAMPELNRFFYTAIGGDWDWLERLPWTYQNWLDYLQRPELQTWVVNLAGVPAGYFELEKQPGDDIEIAYFGLLPQFTEAGLGGWALSEGTLCLEANAKRVWVHTGDLDHRERWELSRSRLHGSRRRRRTRICRSVRWGVAGSGKATETAEAIMRSVASVFLVV